jgi:hypothetical protein
MQRGTSGDDRHPADWELQREQLSAYLDDELEPAERAALERHLPDCPRCQSELRELRELRGLLRALPVPALPRSFVLPADGPVPIPLSHGSHSTSVAAPGRAARRGPRIAEWAGALAASLGLALLLGTALASHGASSVLSGAAPASSRNTRVTAGASQTAQPGGTFSGQTPSVNGENPTPFAGGPQAHTPSPTPTATPTGQGSGTPNGGQGGTPAAESAALPLTGAGLFVGGAVVFVVGRVSARRRSAA